MPCNNRTDNEKKTLTRLMWTGHCPYMTKRKCLFFFCCFLFVCLFSNNTTCIWPHDRRLPYLTEFCSLVVCYLELLNLIWYSNSGVARTFGAHGQQTLQAPPHTSLFLWPLPKITSTLHTFISIMILRLLTGNILIWSAMFGATLNLVTRVGLPYFWNTEKMVV